MHALGAAAFGGALGSGARHLVNIVFVHMFGRPGPFATAAVNLMGSAAIGLLAGLIASGRVTMTPHMRTFVFVGLLGGFTTFSSFMLDTLTLTQAGNHTQAAWNIAGQIVAGVLAVYICYFLAVR
jgi:fluoride exporter